MSYHDLPRRTVPEATGVGIKGAEMEAILQAAQDAQKNYDSKTTITHITIYTDSQEAYSECRHAYKSASDRITKIYDITSRLHFNHHIQLRVAWVPAHSGIRGNEWAQNEARAALSKTSAPIVPTTCKGLQFASSQPEETQPDPTERAALAKQERRNILRNLRTAAASLNRYGRQIPPMPTGVSRKAQALIRRVATDTLLLPAQRHRIFQNAPHHGYCTLCGTLATTRHVFWVCPKYAKARSAGMTAIPEPQRPNTFEDWVVPQDKPPPTVRLLWTQLNTFFYSDGGPAERLL